jgi:predicted negative regulator of RcsB-dependent stress response
VSDYLTDEEQIARLKSWWDENGKSLVIGVVVVVLGFVGYRWYEASSTEQNIVASDLYEEFLASEGDALDEALGRLAEQAAGSSYQALALLRQAKASVVQGDYDAAESQLRDAVVAAPEALLADIARLRLARVLQQLDRMDEALGVLGEIRSAGYRVPVAELRGDIHLLMGDRALAHEAYAAALADAGDLMARPVLEMKLADTAAPAAAVPVSADQQAEAGAAEAADEEVEPDA